MKCFQRIYVVAGFPLSGKILPVGTQTAHEWKKWRQRNLHLCNVYVGTYIHFLDVD